MHDGISSDHNAGNHVAKYSGDEDHDVDEGDRQDKFQRQMFWTPDRPYIIGLAQIHQLRDIIDD